MVGANTQSETEDEAPPRHKRQRSKDTNAPICSESDPCSHSVLFHSDGNFTRQTSIPSRPLTRTSLPFAFSFSFPITFVALARSSRDGGCWFLKGDNQPCVTMEEASSWKSGRSSFSSS